MEKVWEIYAIRGNPLGRDLFKIYEDIKPESNQLYRDGGQGTIEKTDTLIGYRSNFSNESYSIYAVKRLSDGTIFSIGDEVKYPSETKGFILNQIEELPCGSIKLSSEGIRYVTSRVIVGDFKKVSVIKREAIIRIL